MAKSSPKDEVIEAETAADQTEAEDQPKRKFPTLAAGGLLAVLLAGGAGYYASLQLNNSDAALGDLQAKYAALEATVDQKMSAAQADDLAARAELAAQIDALKAELDNQITALGDQVAAVDSVPVEARLSQVEAKQTALAGELSSLSNQIENLSSGDVAAVSVDQAEIDGLRSAVAELSSRLGGMDQQIDDIQAVTDRRIGEASETTQQVISDLDVQRAVNDIQLALEAGGPYAPAYERLADSGLDLADALGAHAKTGVVTLASLKSSYSSAAHAALKASIQGSEGNRLASFFKSQVTVRSIEPQEGDSTDAILSRIGAALEAADLGQAVREAASLDEAAQTGMGDWLSSLRARHSVAQALAALTEGSSK